MGDLERPGPLQARPELLRTLSLPVLVLYGLGTTIGAGIYALIGEVAGLAGMHAPWAFMTAALLAAFTGLSFAELSSRHPRSAGEAIYVTEGFGRPALGTLVGLLVATAGIVSAATMVHAFAGYFAELVTWPREVSIAAVAMALGVVAVWGIRESAAVAVALTFVEVGGLLAVLWAARGAFTDNAAGLAAIFAVPPPAAWGGVSAGALLAFYAFLGFEDMVNVAEEVRDASRAMPVAIVWTLVLTLAVYMAVAAAAVLVLAPSDLAGSAAPLARVYEAASGRPATLVATVSVLAMINGALIQVIMAARVLYGLAVEGRLPSVLAAVGRRTHTPWIATAVAAVVVCLLAWTVALVELARITSLVTLTVFVMVDAALVRIKLRVPAPEGVRTVPLWVPAVGAVVSAGFLGLELLRRLVG